jgi:uncharacterized protein
MPADTPTTKPRTPCPVCRRPNTAEYRPFCSRRCADVDLSRWLTGAYAIPAEDQEAGSADSAAEGPGDPADVPKRRN